MYSTVCPSFSPTRLRKGFLPNYPLNKSSTFLPNKSLHVSKAKKLLHNLLRFYQHEGKFSMCSQSVSRGCQLNYDYGG